MSDRRRAGKSIVVTNGCFDILHAGHVSLLKYARMCGDIVIVALNDDASVSRLKGPSRPVNMLQDRAAVLSAIRYVDYVIAFSDDTPAELIRAISPDVLVKGGDYRPEEVIGSEYAARLEIMPLVPGLSTTAMLTSGDPE